ncbi:MAG: putative exported protein [Oceanicaulis sp. HLUCCA04]|nr:MAG: putative exported protein [Oceanicaulis sp. HLUCCA04]
MYRRRQSILLMTVIASALIGVLAAGWVWSTRNPAELTLQELAEAAGQSYIYGYPLVLMDETRRDVVERSGLSPNRLAHVRTLPEAGFTAVVRPNADTLYSLAWLELSDTPLVLEIPAMEERYWLFQGLDAWTNVFADPGVRTLGNGQTSVLIAGPDFQGEVPEGMVLYRSPTRMAWLLGRIEIESEAELSTVHRLQDGVRLYPYRSMPGGQGVSLDRPAAAPSMPAPPDRVAAMDAPDFFNRLAMLMEANPPADGDREALARLRALNAGPGEAIDWSGYGILSVQIILRGVAIARERLAQGPEQPAGWVVPENYIGRYGENYAYRAGVSLYGLGANLPEDAIYPSARTDANGEPLQGGQRYRIRFAPEAMPPVNGFWSVTLYDADGYFIANAPGRYARSSRDALIADEDGAITLDIHAGPPEPGREANWLPAPQDGAFTLLARLYWPQETALNGEWTMPPVERVD